MKLDARTWKSSAQHEFHGGDDDAGHGNEHAANFDSHAQLKCRQVMFGGHRKLGDVTLGCNINFTDGIRQSASLGLRLVIGNAGFLQLISKLQRVKGNRAHGESQESWNLRQILAEPRNFMVLGGFAYA